MQEIFKKNMISTINYISSGLKYFASPNTKTKYIFN